MRNLNVATVLLLINSMAFANRATAQSENPENVQKRWLLLACGLPGDSEHREKLTLACEQILGASQQVLGVSPEKTIVLAGDELMQKALSGLNDAAAICDAESLQKSVDRISKVSKTSEACWIILLGHAHLYDRKSQFNIFGNDIDQNDFARWLQPLKNREQVIWITTPVSGFWLKPLSQKGRVVICATEASLEFTGTEMPYALAQTLSTYNDAEQTNDIDRDAHSSLLDLYIRTCVSVTGRFQSIERLQTEHAQLDDNGDGRGTELQQPYIDAAMQSKMEVDVKLEITPAVEDATNVLMSSKTERQFYPGVDGFLSQNIFLSVPAK